MATTTRLIEKWMPVNQISIEAIRERAGAVPNPAPHQLHVWWARRPLAPSRATTLLSLLPESADSDTTRHAVFKLLGTSDDIHTIAKRIADTNADGTRDKEGYGNKRRAFTHNPTQDEIAWMNENLVVPRPLILDVTAGGGSIPFEAGRLGFHTVANELNPVASLILRATCEWPQRHGYALLDNYQQCAPIFQSRVNKLLAHLYPDEQAPECSSGDCPHPQRHRCVDECAESPQCSHQKLGNPKHLDVRAQRYAQTYLWARTVLCPGCDVEIPLSPNWTLDNEGTGLRIQTDATRIDLHIVHDRQACSKCLAMKNHCHQTHLYPDNRVSDGTVTRAIATCPACGTTTPKGYLAQEAQAGRMGHRLYCVIYRDSWREKTKTGKERKRETTCRVFAEPGEHHFASDSRVASETSRLQPQWENDDILPNEAVPHGNDQRPHTYGMGEWVNMFNPRQRLALGYCVQAFRKCVDDDKESGKLDECRRIAWACIALTLDKIVNRNSVFSIWDHKTNKVVQTFLTHGYAFKTSYAEIAVTGQGLGLDWSLNEFDQCLSAILQMTGHTPQTNQLIANARPQQVAPPSQVITGNGRELPLDDKSVDCIVFDPPYEENVCYAELSDFFYVWLKRTAGYVFPDHFTDYLTEKDQEAISSPARFKHRAAKGKSAKTLALADYQQKMSEIFAECRRVIKDAEGNEGIMTVMFNHKSTTAWDALTVALIEAEFSVTRTWPVITEPESSFHIKGKAAARTTILLVCRPRQENPYTKPWHVVEELIAQAVRDDIRDNLSQADLRPIDLYLSAFGPALRIISEHWGTYRETRNPDRPEDEFLVTPTDALQVARREVSRHRALEISANWANSPTDPSTKFYILAKDATDNDTLLFDEANLLARAIGVQLGKNDTHMRRIIGFKADKVNLLSAKERMAARDIGEDINTRSTLDVVQTAIALTERRNTADAQQWLTQRMHDANDGQFRYTLEALINTTKLGHDDYLAQRNLRQALYRAEPTPQPEKQPTLFGD